MKWILPFLLFIFLGELVAYFCDPNLPNVSIYYIIGIGESFFYSYIFFQLSDSGLFKKIIFLFASVVILIYILGFIFFQQDTSYYTNSLIVSGFSLSLIAVAYIYFSFIVDSNTYMLREPGFWIALGVSLFFSGISIVFSLHDFILDHNLKLFGVKLYNIVPRILCIVLYLCISIAIILHKKKTKTSLQPPY